MKTSPEQIFYIAQKNGIILGYVLFPQNTHMKNTKLESIIAKSFVVAMALIVLIGGSLRVYQQWQEGVDDVRTRAFNYAENSTDEIMSAYKAQYDTNFETFRETTQKVMNRNGDVIQVRILDKEANILFDSQSETEQPYEGDVRNMDKPPLIPRLEDAKPSTLTEDRVAYYVRDPKTESLQFMNKEEEPIDPVDGTEQILGVLYPSKIDPSLKILYSFSHQNLMADIAQTGAGVLALLILAVLGSYYIAKMLSRKILVPVHQLAYGASVVSQGNFDYRVPVEGATQELQELTNNFNKMTSRLKESTQAVIEKERIHKELEIASQIQKSLLPEVPKVEGLEIAASVKQAEDVGGDCYDFLQLDDDNTIIYIGDAAGHGIPASLVVAITNVLFYNVMKFKQSTEDLIQSVNQVLKIKTNPRMFVTAILCKWNKKENTFHYTSAGHQNIIHYSAQEEKTEMCQAKGMAMGLIDDISPMIHEEQIELKHDDVLVLYSDGIPEARNENNELLGYDQFQHIVNRVCKGENDVQKIHDAILEEVTNFMGSHEAEDDITLVIVKKK